MSKILFIADLHGNMVATEALEKEIEIIQPDTIWFLGDAVGKGPENHKTVDWVRKNAQHFLSGNWDIGIVEGAKSDSHNPEQDPCHDAFYQNQLGKERLDWLESLPLEDEVMISGISFRLFHGRPVDSNYHSYLSMDELRSGFTDTKGNVHGGFISADGHMPYIRSIDQGYAINTGSVGNSLGIPRCHALLIEGALGDTTPSPINFQILSIPYDNQLAAAKADEYPGFPDKEFYQNEILTGRYRG
ncbi:MAG: metallophosphoesterase family protein [Lachnospiraceae bacterium]|nr:metallophosphoesterase family protein [Lachnospiraceae bacterium]